MKIDFSLEIFLTKATKIDQQCKELKDFPPEIWKAECPKLDKVGYGRTENLAIDSLRLAIADVFPPLERGGGRGDKLIKG
jgi:hypothetical protein